MLRGKIIHFLGTRATRAASPPGAPRAGREISGAGWPAGGKRSNPSAPRPVASLCGDAGIWQVSVCRGLVFLMLHTSKGTCGQERALVTQGPRKPGAHLAEHTAEWLPTGALWAQPDLGPGDSGCLGLFTFMENETIPVPTPQAHVRT